MTYEEQLQSPKWKAKRQKILDRDWHLCQKCMNSQNLDVHHKYYVDGKMAWDYPNSALVTLCRKCHEEVHGINHEPITGLEVALERLVVVAKGVRQWCLSQKPEKDG